MQHMHAGFGFLPLVPLLWIGLIVLFGFGMRRRLGWRGRPGPTSAPYNEPFEPNALEMLRRRYVRGEIDGTTFDQMRERLDTTSGPRSQ